MNVIHYVSPSLKANNKKNGNPRKTNVVKGDCTLKRILIAGPAVGVVLVPIDTVGGIPDIVVTGQRVQSADY